MKSRNKLAVIWACVIVVMLLPVQPSRAAGAVEMQVERIVTSAMDEYNQAMEAGDPDAWLKYFTSNVRRQSPQSTQTGQSEFSDYYRAEFEVFKARWTQKKVIIMGRSAAVLGDWEAVHKKSGAAVKVEMAAFFDLASSGRFENLALVYDPAQIAKLMTAGR